MNDRRDESEPDASAPGTLHAVPLDAPPPAEPAVPEVADEAAPAADPATAPALPAEPRPGGGRGWIGFLLFAAVAAGAWALWTRPATEPARAGRALRAARPLPVVAVPARIGNVDVYIDGLGSVVPVNIVTVKSRVDGQLMSVHFKEGQEVAPGELLAEIDPRPFRVQVEKAEGQMARDQALLKNAEVDLARFRTLFSQDSIAKQQVDTQASLVRQYQAALKVDQSQIDDARLQLSYTQIKAPIGGRLGFRQVDPGNMVHASDQNGIVVITQLQPISVVFTIPEDDLPALMKKVRAGDRLPVDAYDRSGRTRIATGTLLTVDNQIDPSTGTVKLKAEFPNRDHALFPNQYVNARLRVDVRHGATVIPSAAVQRGTPGTFVYVVGADDTVSVHKVVLGPAHNQIVAVESGVAPGDRVVVDGGDKLREGAKVELVTPNGGLAAGGTRTGKDSKARRNGATGNRQHEHRRRKEAGAAS